MCEFVNKNKCQITQGVCPFMYFCDKTQTWKENSYMPKNCHVKNQNNTVKHKGKYKVRDCRKGYVYVDIEGYTHKIKNPFDFVPDYVDIIKRNGKYIIKK